MFNVLCVMSTPYHIRSYFYLTVKTRVQIAPQLGKHFLRTFLYNNLYDIVDGFFILVLLIFRKEDGSTNKSA